MKLDRGIVNLPRRTLVLVYICLACLVLLLASVILKPFVTLWQNLEHEVATMEMQFKKNLKIVSKKNLVTKQFEAYAHRVSLGGTDSEEKIKLRDAIDRLAKEVGINLPKTEDLPPKKKKYYKEYTVEVEAEGDMREITTFIWRLQTSPQALSVEYLKIRPKDAQGSSELKCDMLIKKVLIF